tara:strand:+ start:216 stop:494 length:279 start_codon:yes stop_codon:yes gene_type:complete
MNDTEGKFTTPATETAAWNFQLADEHHKKLSPAATNLRAMYLFSGMSGATKVTTLYSNLASGEDFTPHHLATEGCLAEDYHGPILHKRIPAC